MRSRQSGAALLHSTFLGGVLRVEEPLKFNAWLHVGAQVELLMVFRTELPRKASKIELKKKKNVQIDFKL